MVLFYSLQSSRTVGVVAVAKAAKELSGENKHAVDIVYCDVILSELPR